MAQLPVGVGVPVRVHGQRVAQAFPGRARGERQRACRHRNQRGRPQGGHRGRRGHEGGPGQPGAVLSWHGRTRPQGRAARGGRPVRGTRPHRQLHAFKSEIPAVHGAFHAQRALQDAADPQGMDVHGAKAVFAMESRKSAPVRAGEVAREMEGRRLKAAVNCLREGIGETTTYLLPGYPAGRRRRIRTNNRSNGPTGRSGGARAWPAVSPTATAPSCSSERASGTSPRTNGRPAATWTCPGSMTTSWK